jgi:hypothetical protein
MKTNEVPQLKTPPGVIETLTAGFELITRHVWIILIPFIVDLLYWNGPRVVIERLFVENMGPLMAEPSTQEIATQLIDMASKVNVMTTLSLPLIGVPALMVGDMPEHTPLPTLAYEPNSMLLVILIMIGLSLLGLFISALYLNLIGFALNDDDRRPTSLAGFLGNVLRSTGRLFGLAIVFTVILIMVWLPLLPVAFLAGLVAYELAVYVMLAGLILVVIYVSLSVPGIVLNSRSLFQSLIESVRLVRGNVLQTTLLLLTIVLISNGTNLLWSMLWQAVDDSSWLTLVSIIGHAFISTALAAAIFVFYRDRWVFAQERLATSQSSSRLTKRD